MLQGWPACSLWPEDALKAEYFHVSYTGHGFHYGIHGLSQCPGRLRQDCAVFSAGLRFHRQHCAVNGTKIGKIIRFLRLPQFAVRQIRYRFYIPLNLCDNLFQSEKYFYSIHETLHSRPAYSQSIPPAQASFLQINRKEWVLNDSAPYQAHRSGMAGPDT